MRTWVCRDSLTLMWHIYSWLPLELWSFPGVSLEKRLPRLARCHMCTSLKAASAPTFTAPKKGGTSDGRMDGGLGRGTCVFQRKARRRRRWRRTSRPTTWPCGRRPRLRWRRVQATGEVAEHTWEVAFMQTVETLWRRCQPGNVEKCRSEKASVQELHRGYLQHKYL